MSILSGYKKYERRILTDKGYQLCSMKTYADSVHFSDESTAQTNLGAIKGITDSTTATSSNVALSAAGGNSMQNQINTLNSNLLPVRITVSSINPIKLTGTEIVDVDLTPYNFTRIPTVFLSGTYLCSAYIMTLSATSMSIKFYNCWSNEQQVRANFVLLQL